MCSLYVVIMLQIYAKYLNKQAFIAKNDRKMMFF